MMNTCQTSINSLINSKKSKVFVFYKIIHINVCCVYILQFIKRKTVLEDLAIFYHYLSLGIINYHVSLFIIKNYASTITLDHRFSLTNTIKRNNIILLYLSNLYQFSKVNDIVSYFLIKKWNVNSAYICKNCNSPRDMYN